MSNGNISSRSTDPPLSREAIKASARITRGCALKGSLLAFLLALVILPCLYSVSFAQASTSTDSTIVEIKKLFDNGSYISAELQARRVLEDRRVSDSARVQLEKYLGFTLVAEGRNESAIEHFVKALRLDSTLSLDPVLTSPKIMSVFETAKREFRAQAATARPAKPFAKGEEKAYLRGEPTFRAMIFPGWDQLHQGRSTKGYILLGAGAASAISAIASDILRRNARTSYLNASTPALAESRYKTYNLYYKTEFYSVSAFVIIYLYSEFDSFLHLPPHFAPEFSPATRSVGLTFRVDF